MGFQIIPLMMLGAYFLYASYYYAAPMFFLKIMLFLAHIRHRNIDICFEERRIIARFTKDGEERVAVCTIDVNYGIQVLADDSLLCIPASSQRHQKRQTL